MKDLMMLFGVTLAKRSTNRQKRIFYSQVEPFFKNLGYTLEFQSSTGKTSRITNLLIGDLSRARYIIVCPYDTPSRSLLPYKYYPFNWSDTLRQENRELFLRTIFFIGACLIAYFVANHFSNLALWLKVISAIILALLVIYTYLLIAGFANPINFNRNSASLALVAALAERTRKNANVAYVLLDKNTESNSGLKVLAQDEHIKNRIIIYLDCLAHGEMLVCAHNPASSKAATKLIAALPQLEVIDHTFNAEDRIKDTNLQFFPNTLHLCVGETENRKFLVRGTRSKKDFKVDIPRLEMLRDGILNYIGG